MGSNAIDYEDAMERFGGNEALYKKLAAKYVSDSHCASLARALGENDAEAAYQEAHALKGVAGNLSFGALYALAAQASDALRAGDAETARALLPQLEQAHEQVLREIEGF